MEYITLYLVRCVALDQQLFPVPGRIPLGYKYEANKYSAETHKIPVPPEEFGGETDYVKILLSVKHFLLVSGVKPLKILLKSLNIYFVEHDVCEKMFFILFLYTHLMLFCIVEPHKFSND
jgi:hypothetical protein